MAEHQDILDRLTLEQEISLLSGRDVWTTWAFPWAGVPAMVVSDGPHGVRRQLGRGDHLGQAPSRPATCFPTAACLAATWDKDLLEEVGRALGEEAAAQGVHVLLGPGLNLKRDPLGGRNFEYFSEDPYLSGKLAAAMVRGIQSAGVAACPKHFAANSQEWLRMTGDSVVDRRTLRELYLTGFEIAVKEGRPRALMSSYNRINGIYANENYELLTQILREEWGFSGAVLSDWGGCSSQWAALAAGSNLEMPGTMGDSTREVLEAIQGGKLSREVVHRRAGELLELILSCHRDRPPADWDREAHHALARRAAAQGAVLLKNQGGLLPLAPGTRAAVLGELALNPRYQGAGSSLVAPTRLERPLDCLKQAGLEILGHAGCAPEDRNRALALAGEAEAVLLWLGLPQGFESEGLDREDLSLPGAQLELLQAVSQVNQNIVIILAGGGAVETPWLGRCRALLYCALGGQAVAGAAADLLTGIQCPEGRLTESFPLAREDAPASRYFPGRERTAEYREGVFVGYRYYQTVEKPVAFPFGFGLSYTSFAYSDLKITRDRVYFQIKNTGPRAGAEVAQLYVAPPAGAAFRPARELKGFCKIRLEPGESRQVCISLDDKAFRYFNIRTDTWEIQAGVYQIQIGSNAADICLAASVEVEGSGAGLPYDRGLLPHYASGRIEHVPDEEFAALLGRPVPPARWDRTAELELNDSLAQLPYARGRAARLALWVLEGLEKRSLARGRPSIPALFAYNMPFRGIAKLSNGLADMKMARAALDLANGHTLRGAWGLLAGFFRNRLAAARWRRRMGREQK